MKEFQQDVIERLVRVEQNLANHLHMHRNVEWGLMVPILIGVIVLLVKEWLK